MAGARAKKVTIVPTHSSQGVDKRLDEVGE